MILFFGIPAKLYQGNGKEKTANYFGDLVKKYTAKMANEYIRDKIIAKTNNKTLEQRQDFGPSAESNCHSTNDYCF